MRISNVGLFVKDLEGARKFFEDFFGAQVHANYEEDDGYKSYIMKFDENPKLELMSKPTVVDEKKDPNRTGFVHICIKVDSREKLDEIIAKFKAANYTILYGRRKFALYLVAGLCFKVLFSFAWFGNTYMFYNLSMTIGHLVPGILGSTMEKQGIGKTLLSLGVVVLIIRLLQIALL